MINLDEDALICDFAETYHVLNMRGLSPRLAAILAVGLSDSSRIKMLVAGRKVSFTDSLLAAIFDKVTLLLWSKTKDAVRGINRPKSLYEALENPKETNSPYQKFDSIDEFERIRAEILGV